MELGDACPMPEDERSLSEPTRLGFEPSDHAFVCGAGIVLGALAGLLLPIAVHWGVDQGVPLPGWLEFLDTIRGGWLDWGRPLIGAAAGLLFAFAIIENSPVLIVAEDEILVEKGSDHRRIPRTSVAGIHREGGNTIIETAQGRRLFEGDVEGGRDRVREVFLDHGWPYES